MSSKKNNIIILINKLKIKYYYGCWKQFKYEYRTTIRDAIIYFFINFEQEIVLILVNFLIQIIKFL
jgi:hypothetical protein